MKALDAVIRDRLYSDVVLIRQVAEYIIGSGGKRLRPAMVLFTAGAAGYRGDYHRELAAVVEFIHTATLLHDDVVDESELRRGNKTANAMFGNAASVLVGDFLYSRAFQMMVGADNMKVMRVLADATNVIAEGEVLQLMNMHDPKLNEEGYLRVIRSKTAKLFEASARLASIIADEPGHIEAACARYGQALGTAFQVIDDVLDYEGEAASLGKNLGDDLREGKVTLPVIHALKNTQGHEHDVLVNAIEHANGDNLPEVLAIIRSSGGIEAARAAAWQEAQRAIDAANMLPDNEYKAALIQLAASLQNRET